MSERMRTYCFGRYMLDIPADAVIKGQGNRYIGAEIKSHRGTRDELKAAVQKRKEELQEGKALSEYFKLNKELSQNSTNHILLGYQVAYGSRMYSIDSYKLDRGWIFTTSQSPYDDKKIDEIIGRFFDYLKNVRYRPVQEIPKEPGFCFENGFISNDGKSKYSENSSLSFSLKKHPDVWINIESNVNTQKQVSLLERVKPTSDKLDSKFPGQIKRISAKDRSINSLPGQEWLNDFPSDDKTGRAQVFIWETNGSINDALHPNIRLSITTGDGVVAGQTKVSSLPLADVIELYEAVVKTIRLRPTSSGL